MPLLDETAAELLASVIIAAGRRLRLALASPRGRMQADIDLARWFDTYALNNVSLPALSEYVGDDQLAALLQGNAIQAVLHELLAARLTDAPEAEVERLSGLFAAAGNEVLSRADSERLFAFFDDQICDLVGRVSGADPELLRQIRQEAFLARIVAAIDRHSEASARRRDPAGDRDFVMRYRRHIVDHHGRLQPPDFEFRRHLIPIDELYVPPVISHIIKVAPGTPLPQIDIWQLADGLDRAVLLGDPGGGKTTASHVLMHRHAADGNRRVPFLVILREFADIDTPKRSVLQHIEHRLETFYQCKPPDGLVENLLLGGSALVIFDGLDELLDTSRRSEVAAVIERFCAEYPLTRILVTSRTIGYDQARLDGRQFECYQIGGFGIEQITEYVHKWFSRQEAVAPGEADSFLDESASAGDLRSNPLMLALMCILYRGEGSIPRSRPEVYEKCAMLLFHKWDASRKIHVELQARNLIEPVLRYLAYWLLTRGGTRPVVGESQLISQTATYFLSRGFEQYADAETAAREFVDFCRGRLWVFTEAGTTGHGEPLYTFTHRTFLEYFAAAYLASVHDSPERLARELAGHVAKSEWDTVAQLAIQIKDHASERGADRIFQTLLADRRYRSVKAVGNILGFLGRCTDSIETSPATVRELTARAFTHVAADPTNRQLAAPLAWLMVSVHGNTRSYVERELENKVTALVESGGSTDHLLGLRLAAQIHNAPFAIDRGDEAWTDLNLPLKFERQLIEAADYADDIAVFSCFDSEKAESILARRSDLPDFLFKAPTTGFLDIWWVPVAASILSDISTEAATEDSRLDYINKIVESDSSPPLVSRKFVDKVFWDNPDYPLSFTIGDVILAPSLYRAAAYMVCVFAEIVDKLPPLTAAGLGSLSQLHPFLMRRWGATNESLSRLPVDERWQRILERWARKEINFTVEPLAMSALPWLQGEESDPYAVGGGDDRSGVRGRWRQMVPGAATSLSDWL
jgi:hypothetical protein